jgi:hypothetical protein
MSTTRIYQALLSAAKAALGDIPAGTPGTPFTPPVGTPYVDLTFMPNSPAVFTLGDDGEDEITGIFQILLKYPPDKGILAATRLGDTLRESFKAGHRVFYDGQEVIIRSSGLGNFNTIDNKLVNPFTIYWWALTRR